MPKAIFAQMWFTMCKYATNRILQQTLFQPNMECDEPKIASKWDSAPFTMQILAQAEADFRYAHSIKAPESQEPLVLDHESERFKISGRQSLPVSHPWRHIR
jgi:hypothetical protein